MENLQKKLSSLLHPNTTEKNCVPSPTHSQPSGEIMYPPSQSSKEVPQHLL